MPAHFVNFTRISKLGYRKAQYLEHSLLQWNNCWYLGLLCECYQLSRPAQPTSRVWPLLACVVSTISQSSDLQQVTGLSNKAGVNPQPPIISWLLPHGKARPCGFMGERANFSTLKHVVLSPGGYSEQLRSCGSGCALLLCPTEAMGLTTSLDHIAG